MRTKKHQACNAVIFVTKCLSLVPGLWKKLVSFVAFWPPDPPGYFIHVENGYSQVYLRLPTADLDASMFKKDDKYHVQYQVMPLPNSVVTPRGHVSVKHLTIPVQNEEAIHAFYYYEPSSPFTVIFSHGNSTDIGLIHFHMSDLVRSLGVSLLSYDYTGYGASTGSPCESKLQSNIRAVFELITSPPYYVPVNKLILYGQSIGSAPTLDLGSRVRGLAGVIIHSGMKTGLAKYYTSQNNTALGHDPFNNIQKIQSLDCPVLIIHGTEDEVINISQACALSKAAKHAYTWWVQDAGHNDIETVYRADYIMRLKMFLNYLYHEDTILSKKDSVDCTTTANSDRQYTDV